MRPLFHDHGMFIADERTMPRYRAAITQVVHPGDVVLDLGAGTGILGYFALDAGASQVVAVDRSEIIEIARELAPVNGMSGRVTHGLKSSLDLDLETPADVAILSMLARFGVNDGILLAALDARHRLLKPSARLVPASLELFGAPVELPEWYASRIAFWDQPHAGIACHSVHDQLLHSVDYHWVTADAPLSTPSSLGVLDLARIESPDLRCATTVRITRPGVVHALAGWVEWTFGEGQTWNTWMPPHRGWKQMLFPMVRPIAVSAGDRMDLTIGMDQIDDVSQSWTWTTHVRSWGKTVADFRQTTATQNGRTTAPGGNREEVLTAAHVVADVCALVDGIRSMGEIAALAHARHPGAFTSVEDAAQCVRRLSRRWAE